MSIAVGSIKSVNSSGHVNLCVNGGTTGAAAVGAMIGCGIVLIPLARPGERPNQAQRLAALLDQIESMRVDPDTADIDPRTGDDPPLLWVPAADMARYLHDMELFGALEIGRFDGPDSLTAHFVGLRVIVCAHVNEEEAEQLKPYLKKPRE